MVTSLAEDIVQPRTLQNHIHLNMCTCGHIYACEEFHNLR